MIENSRIDYKSLKKILDTHSKLKSEGLRDLAITCVAFANAQGGKIIIGIEDKESLPPIGQKINFETANDTITRLRSLCFNVGLQLNEIETSENGADFISLTVHPTLKTIEPPRLKALIEEVLKINPNLSVTAIHSKIGDIDIKDVQKCIYKMVNDDVLNVKGQNKNRTYSLA